MSDKRIAKKRTRRALHKPQLTPQGKRIVAALQEVLNDVTGKKPL